MSQLLEILGKGLVSSLWSVFSRPLRRYESNIDGITARLVERPDDPDMLLTAAVTCFRHQKLDQATRHIDKLATVGTTTCLYEFVAIKACVLDTLGKRNQAIDTMTSSLGRIDPIPGALMFAIGFLYELSGDQNNASAYYMRAVEITPMLYNAHQRLAAMWLLKGNTERAISHYKELAKIDPGDPEIRTHLATLLMNNGQAKQAVGEYQIALTLEPDNWSAENDRVQAYIEAGQYQNAIDALNDIIERQGEFPDLYLQLADLFAKLGNDEKAVENYHHVLELHPAYLEAMVKLGTHHLRMGRYVRAGKMFSQAIEVNDRLLSAYVGLAVAQNHCGWDDRATQTLDMAKAVEPNSTMLFAEVAKLEMKAAAAEVAHGYLNGQDSSPKVGDELLKMQTERFADAVRKHPERADWHYRFGLLLRAQNDVSRAADEFRQAIEINPNYVKAIVKYGLALHELGDTENARIQLQRAVTLEPGYADTYYHLGLMYADQSKYSLAIEQFAESLRRSGSNLDAHVAMAQALETIGMNDRARTSWKAVIELAPDSEQAKLALVAMEN